VLWHLPIYIFIYTAKYLALMARTKSYSDSNDIRPRSGLIHGEFLTLVLDVTIILYLILYIYKTSFPLRLRGLRRRRGKRLRRLYVVAVEVLLEVEVR